MSQSSNKNVLFKIIVGILLFAVAFTENIYVSDVWSKWIYWAIFVCSILCLIANVFFVLKGKESLYKTIWTAFFIAIVILTTLTILKLAGAIEIFMQDGKLSASKTKDWIVSTGRYGEIVFVLIQIAQVTLIPIPSTVVTMVGVSIFGMWPAFFLTCIGQIIGSMIAFFLGKVFGVRIVKWIIGEDSLNKYQNLIKGKDKLMLICMFILPFFPDDVLCLIAGLSSISYLGFFVLMCVSRPLTGIVTSLVADGALNIPLYGWGLVVWALIAVAVVFLLILIWKYSDKIEDFLVNKIIAKINPKKNKNVAKNSFDNTENSAKIDVKE